MSQDILPQIFLFIDPIGVLIINKIIFKFGFEFAEIIIFFKISLLQYAAVVMTFRCILLQKSHDNLLDYGADSRIALQSDAVDTVDYLLHCAGDSQITPLHNAAEYHEFLQHNTAYSHDFLLHYAVDSQKVYFSTNLPVIVQWKVKSLRCLIPRIVNVGSG